MGARAGLALLVMALPMTLPALAQSSGRFPDALNIALPGPNPLPEMRVGSVSDGELRRAVIADIDSLFKAGDFDALEKLAAANRAGKRRTPGGAYLMDLFYTPFSIDVKLDASAFESALARARTYRFKYPKSPTPYVIEAQILHAYAWKARGGKYSLEVRPEQWQGYLERTEKARRLLTDNGEITGEDPHTYVLLAEMMRGAALEDEDFEMLIEVASKRAPDYTPIWFAAIERYYPKYGGDPRAVERFGQMALKANTSAGPEMYARIYLHAWQEYKQDLYRVTGVDRHVLRKAVFDLLNRFPAQHNFEVFGEMACGLGDLEMAAPIIHRLQALPVEDHVWGEIANYQGCRSQIHQAQRRS